MKLCHALVAFLACLFVTFSALAANPDAQNYRRAFALINTAHTLDAEVFARHGRDPILNKVIRGLSMAQPGNDADFNEMQGFIAQNPDWPGIKGIEAIAEQKFPPDWTSAQIIAWFNNYPPVSLAGFYRYIEALNISGETALVSDLVHARWIKGSFSPEEQIAFRANFQQILSQEDNENRLDRLLWKNNAAEARRMYPLVSAAAKYAAEARLGLAASAPNVRALYANVPREEQNDPGLLFELLRWHVRNDHNDQALAILHQQPEDPVNANAWWEQRQIMTRRLMDQKDFEGAYRLAINHGRLEGKQLVEAEFLCGWLALRFLDAPDESVQHFQTLLDHAETPMSRARGLYWLGRAFEALGNNDQAQQNYQSAAALNITYYGQLAQARIYNNPVIRAMPEPTIPTAVRSAFYDRDVIRAVERLTAIGERDRARDFFHAAVEAAMLRADFALLTELAYRIERPDLAIEAGKAASHKNMLMASGGFPLLGYSFPRPPDPAFTHALIRQESMFNPQARSPVGAQGLMQLMPATAKQVAQKLGMRFKAAKLVEPDYNLRLGTAFVQNQIDSFDGSYVLALAGYNSGPRRVREWMQQIGDPRRPNIDVVDWIELIPNHETRNYVQRIMESLQIYRARLAGGQAPLQIVSDLKR